ncbi:MAG: hypothetical protein HOP07_15405 [Bacteriovoracaceae bacterium]|nr:hypothetical protein [Bacteriovoracaceae bacterium]
MKRIIILLVFCYQPTLLMASELVDCGNYKVSGVVRLGEKGFEIVVNEKTTSEHLITLSSADQAKVAIFLNNSISAEVLLNKKFNGTSGQAENVMSIKERIPDPLAPSDTGFSLIKKSECLVK